MPFTERALRGRKILLFLLVVALLGGVFSFFQLGKKEDSVFVIKTAAVSCNLPGASPEEVEWLITEPIEREIQSMPGLKKITSESLYGASRIRVELNPATPPHEIPQRWDELRRRTLNIAPQLPEGASAITVSDDFGDVYGIYYGLVADGGYSWDELRNEAQRIKTRLSTIEGVKRVTLYGEQEPVINLYISLSALAGLSIRPDAIIRSIEEQNRILEVGHKQAGELSIELLESGTYRSLADLENQLLTAADFKQFRLKDVARIERGYREPPKTLMRVDGERAIGIGISTEADADVVKVGSDLALELKRLNLPVGLRMVTLYPEDQIAREATNTFLGNLALSLLIVIGVIMGVMGLREGVVIGSSLLFSIGGTLLLMGTLGEGLNRTSLAGFIIAMGMLVDNAIVVIDNARQAMRRGVGRRKALVDGADQPKWSLLGATLIGILSFLPLYLAPSSVAEIVKPLFVVLALSLLLSWVLALTQTPLFGEWLLRTPSHCDEPFSGRFYQRFDRLLASLLKYRRGVVGGAFLLFLLSLWGMGKLPQNFFPDLEKPYFRADVILPEGYDLRYTEQCLHQMSQWLAQQPEVVHCSYTAGGTPPRYYLASGSVSERGNFGNLLVEMEKPRQTVSVEQRFARWVESSFPDVWLRSSLFKLSPVPDAAIEFGFVGPNIDTLLRLSAEAEAYLWQHPDATNIRQSWGNRIPTWQPIYSQMKGQRIGISRSRLAEGLTLATTGYPLGEYREGDQVLPILLKDEQIGEYNLTGLETMPLFNPAGRTYALEQAVSRFQFAFSRGKIERYNRERVIKVQCDPARGVNTRQLFDRLYDSIRQIPLPAGYRLQLFGEEESQAESNAALADKLPLTALLIFGILLLLFGNYRDPLIVLLLLPLMLVGVVGGLLITGKVFNFFALLGLLGLVGMNIKNGVVLIEQINRLRRRGRTPYEALTEATRSRAIPVIVASGTTILGMIPLLFDALFGAMAATIMGGLLVATLLTIGVLPALYALLYRIKSPDQ